MNKFALGLISAAALVATIPALAQQTPPAGAPAPAAPAAAPTVTTAKTPVPNGVFYRGQGPTQYLLKDRLLGSSK